MIEAEIEIQSDESWYNAVGVLKIRQEEKWLFTNLQYSESSINFLIKDFVAIMLIERAQIERTR